MDSLRGRKVRQEKRPHIDWQVRSTHRRWAATATAAPGENVIGCENEYRGNSVE